MRALPGLPKQRTLSGRSAKSISARMALVADAVFVKAEPLGVNLEQFLLRIPELPFAAHAFAKDAGIQLAAAGVANTIQNSVSFGRKFFAQALLEVWRDAARQTKHVDEGFLCAAVFCALQQLGNVTAQAGNRWRDADADVNAGVSEGLHRFESRFRRRRKRFDGSRDVVIRKRN